MGLPQHYLGGGHDTLLGLAPLCLAPRRMAEPVQFWLFSLPLRAPMTTLVRLAKLRWLIEHDYR